MKTKNILVVMMILISSIGVATAISTPEKTMYEEGGGRPNNPLVDAVKNSLHDLAIFAIGCPAGYVYCYENENIYGDARADAKVFVSDPYIDGTNLYVNYRFDATKYYVYRGLTSSSQIHCNENGCDGTPLGSNGKYLLGSAPSTSQQGVTFVGWDYNSYNGYWSMAWVAQSWFSPFNYNLQVVIPPTLTPVVTTNPPVVTTNPPIQDRCSDNTLYNQCTAQKPLYCYYGNYIEKASVCGCPTGKIPSGETCIIGTSPEDKPNIIPKPIADVLGIKQTPGFESVFAVLGLLVATFLWRKK